LAPCPSLGIFYFNSEDDWEPGWGGDTLVLDDGGKMEFESAPKLTDSKNEIAASSIGNYSLIFERTRHSWHAVRQINCPEDRLRRVFIVVTNPDNLYRTVRDKVMRKKKRPHTASSFPLKAAVI
jgi:hypothetical protein